MTHGFEEVSRLCSLCLLRLKHWLHQAMRDATLTYIERVTYFSFRLCSTLAIAREAVEEKAAVMDAPPRAVHDAARLLTSRRCGKCDLLRSCKSLLEWVRTASPQASQAQFQKIGLPAEALLDDLAFVLEKHGDSAPLAAVVLALLSEVTDFLKEAFCKAAEDGKSVRSALLASAPVCKLVPLTLIALRAHAGSADVCLPGCKAASALLSASSATSLVASLKKVQPAVTQLFTSSHCRAADVLLDVLNAHASTAAVAAACATTLEDLYRRHQGWGEQAHSDSNAAAIAHVASCPRKAWGAGATAAAGCCWSRLDEDAWEGEAMGAAVRALRLHSANVDDCSAAAACCCLLQRLARERACSEDSAVAAAKLACLTDHAADAIVESLTTGCRALERIIDDGDVCDVDDCDSTASPAASAAHRLLIASVQLISMMSAAVQPIRQLSALGAYSAVAEALRVGKKGAASACSFRGRCGPGDVLFRALMALQRVHFQLYCCGWRDGACASSTELPQLGGASCGTGSHSITMLGPGAAAHAAGGAGSACAVTSVVTATASVTTARTGKHGSHSTRKVKAASIVDVDTVVRASGLPAGMSSISGGLAAACAAAGSELAGDPISTRFPASEMVHHVLAVVDQFYSRVGSADSPPSSQAGGSTGSSGADALAAAAASEPIDLLGGAGIMRNVRTNTLMEAFGALAATAAVRWAACAADDMRLGRLIVNTIMDALSAKAADDEAAVIVAGLGALETLAWIGGEPIRQELRERGALSLVYALLRDCGDTKGGSAAIAYAGLELIKKLHVDYSDRTATEAGEAPAIASSPIRVGSWAEQLALGASRWYADIPSNVWTSVVAAAMRVIGDFTGCFVPALAPLHGEEALAVLLRATCSWDAVQLRKAHPAIVASLAGFVGAHGSRGHVRALACCIIRNLAAAGACDVAAGGLSCITALLRYRDDSGRECASNTLLAVDALFALVGADTLASVPAPVRHDAARAFVSAMCAHWYDASMLTQMLAHARQLARCDSMRSALLEAGAAEAVVAGVLLHKYDGSVGGLTSQGMSVLRALSEPPLAVLAEQAQAPRSTSAPDCEAPVNSAAVTRKTAATSNGQPGPRRNVGPPTHSTSARASAASDEVDDLLASVAELSELVDSEVTETMTDLTASLHAIRESQAAGNLKALSKAAACLGTAAAAAAVPVLTEPLPAAAVSIVRRMLRRSSATMITTGDGVGVGGSAAAAAAAAGTPPIAAQHAEPSGVIGPVLRLCEATILAYAAVAAPSVGDRQAKLRKKACTIASEQLGRSGSSAAVALGACSILQELAAEPDNRAMVLDSGAVQLLVHAMRAHIGDAAVCAAACSALRNLCATAVLRLRICHAADSHGAVAALAEVLRCHTGKDEPACFAACGALFGVACEPANRDAVLAPSASACEAVIAAMQAHESSERLAWACCGLLLKTSAQQLPAHGSTGAADAMLWALRRHTSSARVRAAASESLARLEM